MGRKEARKEARVAKRQRRHAWATQQGRKRLMLEKGEEGRAEQDFENAKPEELGGGRLRKDGAPSLKKAKSELSRAVKKTSTKVMEASKAQSGEAKAKKVRDPYNEKIDMGESKKRQRTSSSEGEKKRTATKFEELLEMEMKGRVNEKEDLELERRLAKKLKVKGGKLPGADDELDGLLEGLADYEDGDRIGGGGEGSESASDDEDGLEGLLMAGGSEDEEGEDGLDEEEGEEGEVWENEDDEEGRVSGDDEEAGDEREDGREEEVVWEREGEKRRGRSAGGGEEQSEVKLPAKRGREVSAKEGVRGKYVAPHLRKLESEEKSEELKQVERRLRGLLNRISESNVEGIVSDVALIYQTNGRSVVGEMIANEILGACVSGPRGNDQYAAVFAAFISGMAAILGMDVGANFASRMAQQFEEQYEKGDSLALRNLALLIGHLYNFLLLSR